MAKYQSVRGMKDVLPEETRQWVWIENQARRVFERFGYSEIRTPFLENTDLFIRSIGETSDIVEKEMYTFNDSKGKQISLRPEMTACVVRAYINNQLNQIKKVNKLFYIGPMFRHERPQAGRLRQFSQLGCELIGSNEPISDADVIILVCEILQQLSINDFVLKLNSLGSHEGKEKYSIILKDYLKDKTSSLCDLCIKRMNKNVFRVLDCKNEQCQDISRKAPNLLDCHLEEDQKYFKDVCSFLDNLNIKYEINPKMVRGLDYYTRTVFELTHPLLGSQDAIGAGGRYDNLVETFGGEKAGAVGFAIGIERLLMVLKDKGCINKKKPLIYLISMGNEAIKKNFCLLNVLKKEGFVCDISMVSNNIKNQMKQADKMNARWVIIRGAHEIEKKQVIIKDMDLGNEWEVSENDVVASLSKEIN